MTCAYCGETKPFNRDCFPSLMYAECWPCFYQAHMEKSHKRKFRREKKRADQNEVEMQALINALDAATR